MIQGHVYTFIKCRANAWLKCDDVETRIVGLEEVMRECKGAQSQTTQQICIPHLVIPVSEQDKVEAVGNDSQNVQKNYHLSTENNRKLHEYEFAIWESISHLFERDESVALLSL